MKITVFDNNLKILYWADIHSDNIQSQVGTLHYIEGIYLASEYCIKQNTTGYFAETLPEPDVVSQRKDFNNKVNALASDRILIKFPFYLQNNIGRNPTSIEAISMFAWIDSVRALANIAKVEISTASNMVEIRAAMSTFNDALLLIN